MVGSTGLGDQFLAAMVDIHPTVSALHALTDKAVQHGATVVTPGRVVIAIGLELVRAGLLKSEKTEGWMFTLTNNHTSEGT